MEPAGSPVDGGFSSPDAPRGIGGPKGAATRYDSPARSLPIALCMGQS